MQHSEEQLSTSYGFMSDYFYEILHHLRKYNYISDIKDIIDSEKEITMDIRDEKAILKMIDGFLEILDPRDPLNRLIKRYLK